MSANGYLSPADLAPVHGSDGTVLQLANNTATAFLAMDAACRRATGLGLWAAYPGGAYRDYAMQKELYDGAVHANPDSTITIARPGYSSHGFGSRVDIGSFPPASNLLKFGSDGKRRREWVLKHAAYYGFRREFGEADPNHFIHSGLVKAAWLPYRLDWDEMVSKAELEKIIDVRVEAAVERVLKKKIAKSATVAGKSVSVLDAINNTYKNSHFGRVGVDALGPAVAEVKTTVSGIAGALASTPEPPAPTS